MSGDYGDLEWRLKQMQADMNIMWNRLNDLEEARDEKVEPDCLKENAKLIEENDVLQYQYETMHKETVRCKKQLAEMEGKVFTKQLQIDELSKNVQELKDANKYWTDRSENLLIQNNDLKWRFDNPDMVEKQTARSCLNIVTKIKNDPLTVGEGKRWMVAVCEDIEREIKKEFELR